MKGNERTQIMNMKNRKVNIIGVRSALYSNQFCCYFAAKFAEDFDYLYREDIPDEKMVILYKDGPRQNTRKTKLRKSHENCMIDIKGTCLEGKKVFVVEDREAYYLTEATSLQVETLQKKRVNSEANVGLKDTFIFSEKEREHLNYNHTYKKIEWFCSEEYGFYFTITPLYEAVPKESCGIRTTGRNLKTKGYAVSFHEPNKNLYLPKYFREHANIKIGDKLRSEIRGDKVVVMAADGECAICQKIITRDKPLHIVKVCKKCNSIVEKSSNKISRAFNTIENLTEIE